MSALPPCGLENSIVEPNLRDAALQGVVVGVDVMETGAPLRPRGKANPDRFAYYVVVQMRWSGTKRWYLTTRRDRTRPRLFRDLARLNTVLREIAPAPTLVLHRDAELPEPASDPHRAGDNVHSIRSSAR